MRAKCKHYKYDNGHGGSADICFCPANGCKLKCKRSMNRWFFKRFREKCPRVLYSVSRFDESRDNKNE